MKSFITTFAVCYLMLLILAVFGLGFVYNNFYLFLAVICLPVAVMIEGFLGMEKKIEKLEKRIKELEGQREDE